MNINWNNIRPLNNSKNEAFEELVCQLASNKDFKDKKTFIRKGKPDAGVECYWILNNDDEFAWQAKFFTNSLQDSQWEQIDKSVKTVLDKHPNLKRYYIAIPNAPSDARITGQTSMLDKWDSRVKKWEGWASEKKLTVKFIPWWGFNLIKKLTKPKNVGLTYFWFNKEEFTNEWFKKQTENSIIDLGVRYTPKLNVKLKIAEIFSGISRDEKFNSQVVNLFDNLLIMRGKIIGKIKELNLSSSKIESEFETIHTLFNKTDFKGFQTLPIDEFLNLLNTVDQMCSQIKNQITNFIEEFHYVLIDIEEFQYSIYRLTEFLKSKTMKLANHPFLLIEGEAGIGKSHLLADIVSTRNTNGLISLFFLGQHFVDDHDPWTQIKTKYEIKCNFEEFLGAINSKAQISDQRIIIFIDATNEGRGKYFWQQNIKSFLSKIKKHKWLGVVLSIRSSYSDLIFPKNEIKEDELIRYTHEGFRNQEYEATKMFFNNYEIELPSTPLLHPEFQNPLFLILFCKGLNKSGYTKIRDGSQGITAIIDFFVISINNVLSEPTRLGYSKSINIVKKAIESLIDYKIEKQLEYVSYDQAFRIVKELSNEYNINGDLLDELISEGVLSKNLFWKPKNQHEERVYLAYERFEDHLTATFVIDKNPKIKIAFKEGGTLFHFVKDERNCIINKGLIEAFSIQFPEKYDKEFYEYVPHVKNSYPIIECFVQSLLWRKTETISKKLIKYVNSTVLSNKRTHDLFWDTVLSVTSISNNYFNAYSLHKDLMKRSLPDRDASWTIYLNEHFNDKFAVKRLVDWAWNTHDKNHISDEAVKLTSITLSWFHTSTNRKLRDSATKSLICLLENRIHVLIELLKKFEDINAPYIYERLFSVAYGCAVRTTQKEKLKELSSYIFKTIFKDKDEIYPHILLRDYARGVIEFTSHLGYDLDFDISEARPPYKSAFPNKFPSNADIDYMINYKDPIYKEAQDRILCSMITEHGRTDNMYGDFGRYTFQSALRTWDVNANALSNLALEWIFEKYGYDKDKHGKYDSRIEYTTRNRNITERIGKKYQWIALYEILARVSDNCTKYAEWCFKNKEVEPYQGSWNPNVRDIDPTMVIEKTGLKNKETPNNKWWSQEEYSNWNLEHEEWTKMDDDLPCPKKLINIKDNLGEEWLILEGFPEWREPKQIRKEKWRKPHKSMWYQLRSYLISEDKFEKMKDWSLCQDFMGGWMPESPNRYEVFSREYYWSPAFNYFNKEYYNGIEENEVCDKETKECIGNALLTCINFSFEKEVGTTISFLKPSKHIYENMKLEFSNQEGEFIDENGKMICFDPSVNNKSMSYLLIKKKPFIKYLKENRLRILWTVLGEKYISHNYSNLDKLYKKLEISGAYYLDKKNKIDGRINTKLS